MALLVTACAGGEERPAAGPGADPPSLAADRWAIDPPAAPDAMAPRLAAGSRGTLASWLEPDPGGAPAEPGARPTAWRLRLATFAGERWGPARTVARGEGTFFANWADVPSVVEAPDGSLVAAWLARTGDETYAYAPFLARSRDGGERWDELGPLPDDTGPTEHGFVSWAREGDALRAFWLDGRGMLDGGPMRLLTRRVGEALGPERVLDERVCECCPTDAATTASGPLVVYRDRSAQEVRDPWAVRRDGDAWSPPAAVAVDGWEIAGCPVNGPSVAAGGGRVAVAWFTGAGGRPTVRAALSADGGASFGEPVEIDGEAPVGRVAVGVEPAGSALVAWLARRGDSTVLRVRRLSADGSTGPALDVAVTAGSRAAGMPRLLVAGEEAHLAWREPVGEEDWRLRFAAVPRVAIPPAG